MLRLRGMLIGFVMLLAAGDDAAWGAPPAWGELTAGPHPVGFRVFRTSDRSRGYWPLRSYRGEPNPPPTERPLQISVWYPASPAADAATMSFRTYLELQATALGEPHAVEMRRAAYRELREEMLGRFFPPQGASDAQLEAILGQPTAAFRDAPYASGSFPLLIHSGFGPFAQSVLLEYLASHGYVVATTHMLGSSPAWFHRGSGTLEWWQETARDVAFLRSFATDLTIADTRRTAVVGMTAAAEALRILLDAYPEDAEGWRWLGRSLYALGDSPAARKALERAAGLATELSEKERERLMKRIERDLARLAEDD